MTNDHLTIHVAINYLMCGKQCRPWKVLRHLVQFYIVCSFFGLLHSPVNKSSRFIFPLQCLCNCEGTREAMHYHVIKVLTAVADRCLLEHRISFNRMCVQRWLMSSCASAPSDQPLQATLWVLKASKRRQADSGDSGQPARTRSCSEPSLGADSVLWKMLCPVLLQGSNHYDFRFNTRTEILKFY